MGQHLKLPLDNQVMKNGGSHRFTTNIGDRTYTFHFQYNAVGKFWVLTIKNASDASVLGPKKVVYGKLYEVDAYFALAFFSPNKDQTTLTAENIGDPVIGAVGLLG